MLSQNYTGSFNSSMDAGYGLSRSKPRDGESSTDFFDEADANQGNFDQNFNNFDKHFDKKGYERKESKVNDILGKNWNMK